MHIKLKRDRERSLAIVIIVLLVLLFLSLGLNYKFFADNRALHDNVLENKQVVISPMINEQFSFIGPAGDARYLRLIAMSFIALRLDVNHQTIERNHEVLIGYLDREVKEKLVPVLAQEKRKVRSNSGASAFYLDEIKVSPKNGIVDIFGQLVFSYGVKTLKPINKHYRLRIKTTTNQLKLEDWVELPI